MNQKLLTKVLATMMVMILTMTNFVTLGIYTVSYATSDNLENQAIASNDGNIEFDAYFAVDAGTKTHTIEKDFDDKETKISLAVNVKKGYLKNAKIQITGENGESANFRIVNDGEIPTSVEAIDEQAKTIALKQINAGTGIKLDVPIEAINEEIFDLSNFSKINNIKLIGIYVDNEGKASTIEQTIQTKVEWKSEAKVEIAGETKTYISYKMGEKEKTILQTEISTGLEENALPIQETNIKVQVPELENKKPEKVIVTANTYATNNQGEEKFSENNYTYDEENGILNIKVENKANENKVAWNKEEKDKYMVTYIYDGAKETITAEENVKQTAEVTIKAYNNKITEVKGQATLNIEENGTKGNYITSEISTDEAISKGYLYTKAEKEIEYKEEINVSTTYAEIVDKITIEPQIDNFINSDGSISPTTVGNANYAYYKTTTISKENFEKVLGTDGSIKIYGVNGEQIGEINNQAEVDEQGNYVYKYTQETNQIKIETTKPKTNNTLKITNTKSLKGKTDYSKEQVANFEKLEVKTKTAAIYSEQTIGNDETTSQIELIAPTTKIETQISTQELSTIVKNENVEIRVILKTNDITCDLYKNPKIEIVLPSYIEQLDIKDINLLYDKELEIENYETTKNEQGNTVIKVTLKGEDTVYNQDEISKGANIVINTDITLKQLTPTTNDVMKVYVTNELATTYENNQATKRSATSRAATARTVASTTTNTTEPTSAYAQTTLRAVAPVGMVTTNAIEGYNSKGESVTSISGEEKIGKLETKTEAKTATVKMNIINNYSNKINNISILGRIPFKGNKNTATGNDLGSNLTTTLNSAINTNGINATVYYSTNENATKNVNDSNNGWTTSTENIANAKSYLIVLKDYEMTTGTSINFSYGINIPDNLTHNLETYGIYTVYYDNVKETETTSENVTATKVGLTTGQGPELEATITPNVDANSEIEEGQIITYTVTVKNKGKIAAKNIVVKGKSIQAGKAGVEEQKAIEEITAGESKTVTFDVRSTSKTADEEKIKMQATITATDLEKAITIESVETKVTTGYLSLTFDTGAVDVDTVREAGHKVEYVLKIQNVNDTLKENVIVKDVLPEGVTYVSATPNATYNEQTREVECNLGTIREEDSKIVIIEVTVDKLSDKEITKTIKNQMTVTTSERQLKTEELTIRVSRPNLEISQTSKQTIVSVGETIIYSVVVKNTGAEVAGSINIKDVIPEGLKYIETQYSVDGETYTTGIGDDVATITIPTLAANQSIELSIKMKAEELEEGMTKRAVTNVVTVSATDISEKTSNEIKHTIVPAGQTEVKDPSTDIENNPHKVSGIVWLDSNRDGKQDDNEEKIANIKVTLINSENGQIIKDESTGKKKEQYTNENGAYTFSNLVSGSYMVIFEYDTNNYGLTTYHKDGVNSDKNSDVILIEATISGERKYVAASDTITVGTTTSGNNIDMGLVTSEKFDLKLDKVITKITVQEAGKTITHEFNDSKFAKVDLKEKTANGSSVIIEYKIRIMNEGDIAGYAKKIVDYLPQDTKFLSELNSDWYQSTNGTLYNSSLANTLILPGETKELTLVLTKSITNNNLGLINNSAEIYEAYNDAGVQDIDSTPANKVQSEDDLSSADAMIGIKTGEVYVYIILTTICAGIFALGIYVINKKVLRKI